MNLIIDQGNSAAKIAFFEGKTLVKSFQLEKLDRAGLSAFVDNFFLEAGILSAVNKVDVELYSFLSDTLSVFYNLNSYLPLPLAIDYKTPQTLGVDRIAAAVGAWVQRPHTNLLIIDLGTAITFDWVTAQGVFKGGNISPGPDLRLRALHQFTDRLPLVSLEGDTPSLGYDTSTAIRSGVVEGIVREVDSYIDEYKKNQDVFTFLTGGYSFYFESKLKSSIFADGNLVLKGLNEILNYQKRKE